MLLVTDGKSHALDVQELARTGRRFGVVLVGEDSLEANVGHLAALSGGEIFAAAGGELADVVGTALRSLRLDHTVIAPITGKPQRIVVRRAGMTVTADWRQPEAPGEDTIESRAVAAVAASLALPALDAEAAAALAESEGLVTHLTSLVLVDEAAAVQDGLPGARKVLLPAPRTNLVQACMPAAEAVLGFGDVPRLARRAFAAAAPARSAALVGRAELIKPRIDLYGLGTRIDWDSEPARLRAGDLSKLDQDVARAIRETAKIDEVRDLADQLGLDPVIVVIGLMARAASPGNRSAARIAHAIFGSAPPEARLDAVARVLRIA